jgi:ketosteroid isomerase-like protein
MPSVAALAVVLTLVLTVVSGCQTWDEANSLYITDANTLLHRSYPSAVTSHDLDRLLELYSDDLVKNPAFVAQQRELLDRFSSIDSSSCVILNLDPYNGSTPAKATVELTIDGRDGQGKRQSHTRRINVKYARIGDAWAITEEETLTSQNLTDAPTHYAVATRKFGLDNLPGVGLVKDLKGVPREFISGCGVAIGDVNGDGMDDVYLANSDHCRLLLNRNGRHLEDVTENARCDGKSSGLARLPVLADYDNDGRTDIFVGVIGGPNLLYHQETDGTFTEVAEKAGLTPTLETNAAIFADFDDDGFLDLYIVNARTPWVVEPSPVYNALNALPNSLFMNNGDGTFRDTSDKAGVAHSGFGLAAAAADYDLDGDVDIFVGNDFGLDVLYRNRGNGIFDDVSAESGLHYRGSSMSASWGDVDGDGYPDLFASGMYSNSKWMIDQPTYPAPAPWPISFFLRGIVLDIVKEMMGGNLFYRNNGNGTFSRTFDETRNTGWAWGSAFLDADNDARLDLYVVNGLKSGEDRKDL